MPAAATRRVRIVKGGSRCPLHARGQRHRSTAAMQVVQIGDSGVGGDEITGQNPQLFTDPNGLIVDRRHGQGQHPGRSDPSIIGTQHARPVVSFDHLGLPLNESPAGHRYPHLFGFGQRDCADWSRIGSSRRCSKSTRYTTRLVAPDSDTAATSIPGTSPGSASPVASDTLEVHASDPISPRRLSFDRAGACRCDRKAGKCRPLADRCSMTLLGLKRAGVEWSDPRGRHSDRVFR